MAPPLIEALEPGRDLVADRGYDARALIDLVEAAAGGLMSRPAVIVRSSDGLGATGEPALAEVRCQRGESRDGLPATCASVDPALYRQRNLIQRFFNNLKHFRRIATRYDKTARNFLAAGLLAATTYRGPLRKRTPVPLLSSPRNSTPAEVSAPTILAPVSARPPSTPSGASRRFIVGIETSAAVAKSSCDQPKSARAALICRIDTFCIDIRFVAIDTFSIK
ncbi:hypothetical protein ACVWZV_004546 [Bradyrhizobium sp. GM5.1]